MKGVSFHYKMVYKRVRVWTLGWSLPVQNSLAYPSWGWGAKSKNEGNLTGFVQSREVIRDFVIMEGL